MPTNQGMPPKNPMSSDSAGLLLLIAILLAAICAGLCLSR